MVRSQLTELTEDEKNSPWPDSTRSISACRARGTSSHPIPALGEGQLTKMCMQPYLSL